MTNINSTSVPLPTDPLGSAIVAILAVIGVIVLACGGAYLIIKGTEKIQDFLRRIDNLQKRIEQLEKSSVSPETKTVGD